jgi:hypothetical protein
MLESGVERKKSERSKKEIKDLKNRGVIEIL